MPTFPRTLPPRHATEPKVPSGLNSMGHTGKPQFRTTLQVGRSWEERWPDLRAGRPEVEELLATIEAYHQAWTLFDIEHPRLPGCGTAPRGVGGGTPVVSGAGQTGSSIATSGWPLSTADVVRVGDCITFAGLTLLYRVTADASSDGSGNATLSITPPIPAGGSPANGAALSLTNNVMRAAILDYTAPDSRPGIWMRGLTVRFQEVP